MHTFWSDILFTLRFVSPFAFVCALLATTCLLLYLVTKWREFFAIGLTAAVYTVPFVLWGDSYHH